MTHVSRDSEESDKDDLLALLQAHGQNFLSSFRTLPESTNERKRKRRKLDTVVLEETVEEDNSDNEWTGFDSSGSEHSESGASGSDHSESAGDEELDDVQDDDFRSDHPAQKEPEVVVFSSPSQSESTRVSKSLAKSFMSSKVSKLRQEITNPGVDNSRNDDNEDEDERTNLQNDALLHKLVHTKLLSGSLNSELNLTPAQRRRALEGRVLELAAGAKLGKGEVAVKQEERSKASKKVRMGLERKVEERRQKAVEEAKELGNYHPSIKRLYDANADKKPDRKKRDRGLKLGVGKFAGGVLKLRKSDIASVQGDSRPSRGGFRGGRRGSGRN
ncbi:uncharacterized protein FOMMEDRAFT_158463 [Fomitiporia mediterranea MF3/22]|uniref:uncharacterized protein n=1 Tax=Fomitiporia mediterranea (strain MF3/22) TaxID=694068 RepID=UPI0004408967|nr:uncharacterized protein FOMMEDRAFT_158463 [Fomitiporia mediterranea MF3/22]EJD01330.1 hypothetical protein FOMMEDRAFT_158463 [Fomitiporia mediterranea MF3/22]